MNFANVPLIKKNRSVFSLNTTVKTAFNMGELIPFYVQEVYPGDEFSIKTDFVCRLTSTFIKVPFDNLFMDTMFFFVPNRIIDKDFPGVMGENLEGYWKQDKEYTVPQVSLSGKNVTVGSIADFLGLPPLKTGTYSDLTVSQYPFRGLAKIHSDWWRNENTEAPALIDTGSGVKEINGDAYGPDNIYGMPPKVSKFHDYFTSCLPAPQKGDPVTLSVGGDIPLNITVDPDSVSSRTFEGNPVFIKSVDPDGIVHMAAGNHLSVPNNGGLGGSAINYMRVVIPPDGLVNGQVNQLTLANDNSINSYPNSLVFQKPSIKSIIPNQGDISFAVDASQLSAISVNDLRYAFQLQKMLERDARAGTRYTEILQAHFGVISPDARLQRSEYLGGNRQPINITQVTQTSAGSEDSPQANLAAFSQTTGRARSTKAFVEHGFVIGVCCIRQKHTYQQGIERFWFRKSRYDFYDPVFANIGEQPVYSRELFANAPDGDVFGYNEAWADLRYKPDRVCGVMRSTAPQSLDVWHFGDYYDNQPYLNNDFLYETADNVDRTISVPSTTTPQFMVDFYVRNRAVRVMPAYSIPSLIDHN